MVKKTVLFTLLLANSINRNVRKIARALEMLSLMCYFIRIFWLVWGLQKIVLIAFVIQFEFVIHLLHYQKYVTFSANCVYETNSTTNKLVI